MPERHLGLTTVNETADFKKKLNILGEVAENHIDLDKLIEMAKNAPLISFSVQTDNKNNKIKNKDIKIGIIKDSAFQFYYPENLEALQLEGAIIKEFDSIKDNEIKDVDLLYIAGGFPEVHAEKLEKNKVFRDSIKYHAEKGMPIYGECGAVIYLGKSVIYHNKKYEMCNVFPLDFELKKKPVGHGYTDIEIDKENPYFPKESKFKGHEFHYSLATNWNGDRFETAFAVKKGFGFDGKRDGVFKKNVFATYTHLHATGEKDWAKHLIQMALKVKYKN
jgi:cobyrinic acid a,c-diamide synthase